MGSENMKSEIKIIQPADFANNFMNFNPSSDDVFKLPFQVFKIEETVKFLKIPAPLYRPDYNFVVYINIGTAKQQVDTEIVSLSPSDVLFVKQGYITALIEVIEVSGFIIVFQDGYINQLLSESQFINIFSSENKIKLNDTDSKWINMLFNLIFNEFYSTTRDIDICYSLFQAGLLKIISNQQNHSNTISRSEQITFLFKELVYKNYLNNKAISFYANELHVSENYLNRCIKKTMGIAPKEWIIKMSIIQSQILLRDKTKSITEIAFLLHYEDPSYFGRLFKKITGITPSEYRDTF
jgi:AraC family transcriptional activator of pobA